MNFKKRSLFKLGKLPHYGTKGGYKAQVEWLLKAEALLVGIIDLGQKNEDLDREAFSDTTVNSFIKLFPHNIFRKMLNLPGKGC